jgi:hypothetical protein
MTGKRRSQSLYGPTAEAARANLNDARDRLKTPKSLRCSKRLKGSATNQCWC